MPTPLGNIYPTIAVPDHNGPTTPDRLKGGMNEESRIQVEALDKNAKDFGIHYYPVSDVRQGIVHIVGPEQGWTLPGMTVVCGDSHTATHGQAYWFGLLRVRSPLLAESRLIYSPRGT